MLDVNGQKILSGEEAFDKDFALNEIKFFLKAFRKNIDEKIAYHVAQMINEYMKKAGEYADVVCYLEELEEYASNAGNISFLWQLVYARRECARLIVKKLVANRYEKAVDSKHIAAKLFEYICKIEPSEHYKRCRAYEYIGIAVELSKAGPLIGNYKGKIGEICDYTEKLFCELEVADNSLYYDTGRLLYYFRYFLVANQSIEKASEVCEYIRKALHYTRKLLGMGSSLSFYSTQLVFLYERALLINGFATQDELDKIERICDLMQKNIENGVESISENYEKLKQIKEKVNNAIK